MAIDETPVCAKPYTGFDKVASTQIFTLINPSKNIYCSHITTAKYMYNINLMVKAVSTSSNIVHNGLPEKLRGTVSTNFIKKSTKCLTNIEQPSQSG